MSALFPDNSAPNSISTLDIQCSTATTVHVWSRQGYALGWIQLIADGNVQFNVLYADDTKIWSCIVQVQPNSSSRPLDCVCVLRCVTLPDVSDAKNIPLQGENLKSPWWSKPMGSLQNIRFFCNCHPRGARPCFSLAQNYSFRQYRFFS